MDFEQYLSSDSVKSQSYAAVLLRAEGANGAKHLPALLQRCQAIDANDDLDRCEEALLGFGAMTMGDIVAAIGFESQDLLHVSILRWIVQATSSPNLNVAAHSVYGLGNLGIPHPEVIECLCRLVTSERRSSELEHVFLRAIALRNLKRLDASIATTFVDVPALDEYAHAGEYWIRTNASKSDENRLELQGELEWLMNLKDRRTKR